LMRGHVGDEGGMLEALVLPGPVKHPAKRRQVAADGMAPYPAVGAPCPKPGLQLNIYGTQSNQILQLT
jgi:hypothetical protein